MNKPKKVAVYRNLHRIGYVYSVQDFKTKRVTDRTSEIFLKDCEFKVSESGRQRVLREKRKNVHAKIVGTRLSKEEWDETLLKLEVLLKLEILDLYYLDGIGVSYNPYKYPTFVCLDGTPVFKAKYVVVSGESIRAFNITQTKD